MFLFTIWNCQKEIKNKNINNQLLISLQNILVEKVNKKTILATLCYVLKGNEVLLLQRNKKDKKSDLHQADGKSLFVGLGGKLESFESPRNGIIRELQEEAGINIVPNFRGIMYFIDIRTKPVKKEQHWIVFIYTADFPENGQLVEECKEGTLHWIEKSKINELPMWQGDYKFLNKLFTTDQIMDLCHKYVDGKLEE